MKSDVVVLLMSLHLAGEVLGFDSRCKIDNGIVPDQSRCDTFLICVLGNVRRRVTCSNGLLFDEQLRKCNYKEKVNCGVRLVNPESEPCVSPNITITIIAENDRVPPHFTITTSVTAPTQRLRNFLLMAAGQDDAFRFTSRDIGDFGEFVTSINGLMSDPAALTAWVPFMLPGGQISQGIKAIIPSDGSVYLFKYYSFLDGCTDDACQSISRRFLQ